MDILVIGGTRYFGIPMVNKLLHMGHSVTIATRGITFNKFASTCSFIKLDISDYESVQSALMGKHFDLIIDKITYSSLEIKNILETRCSDKIIHMSTAGVYNLNHFNISENEFDGNNIDLIWCKRRDLGYDEEKRSAECALCKVYNDYDWTSVRYPFVIGKNDYTKRLYFYVKNIINEIPIYIDNLDTRFSVINENDAGEFIAFLSDKKNIGPVNGCSPETISVREIVSYIERKTRKTSVIDKNGLPAPYNGTKDNSLSTAKANNLGFTFKSVHRWFEDVIDYYIKLEVC